jgi:hypothetical protein
MRQHHLDARNNSSKGFARLFAQLANNERIADEERRWAAQAAIAAGSEKRRVYDVYRVVSDPDFRTKSCRSLQTW